MNNNEGVVVSKVERITEEVVTGAVTSASI